MDRHPVLQPFSILAYCGWLQKRLPVNTLKNILHANSVFTSDSRQHNKHIKYILQVKVTIILKIHSNICEPQYLWIHSEQVLTKVLLKTHQHY